MLGNNFFALILTLVICVVWLRIIDFIASRKWVSSPISRKIIHIGTGPIFVLCWPFFTNEYSSRFFAAVVPLLITAQFFMVGAGIVKDQAAVDSMSRSGDRREILKGPLYYGIVFVLLTVIFWKDSLIGIVALMILCGGDGMGYIIGTTIKSPSLPWSKNKTTAGSLAVFLGGWILSLGIIWVYILIGLTPGTIITYLIPVTIITIITTIIESLPFNDIDNITVPIAAILIGLLLL